MQVDRTFWQGKTVFVTGHTGFKGGWLASWLRDMDAKVYGYGLMPNTAPSYYALCGLEKHIKASTIGDILEISGLHEAMARAQPEIVFHLAAQPLVRRSYCDPSATFAINVLGTVNLLETVRTTKSVRAVVAVTSDKCYENNEWIWGYRENDSLGGHDPYSASKACAEFVCSAYQRSFFANSTPATLLATARAGNVIGGGDWAEGRIIPDAIRAFSGKRPLMVRNPHSVRPWQHVLEPIAGYLLLAKRLYEGDMRYAGAWNFSSQDSDVAEVSELVETIVRDWGNGASWYVEESDFAMHESNYLKLDCSKARNLLQWKCVLSLAEAVEMTAQWYRQAVSSDQDRMLDTSIAQIHGYERRLTESR